MRRERLSRLGHFEEMAVDATDGPAGRLLDVVIEPAIRRATHIVLEVGGRYGTCRLVPISAVASASGRLKLSWSRAQVGAAPLVDAGDESDIVNGPELRLFRQDRSGRLVRFTPSASGGGQAQAEQLRHGSVVVGADNRVLGQLQGAVVNDVERVTKIMVERKRLYRKMRFAVPIEAVGRVEADKVVLTISRAAVLGYLADL